MIFVLTVYLQVERFYFGFDTILYILWSYGIDWPEGGKMRVREESITACEHGYQIFGFQSMT